MVHISCSSWLEYVNLTIDIINSINYSLWLFYTIKANFDFWSLLCAGTSEQWLLKYFSNLRIVSEYLEMHRQLSHSLA